MLKILSFTIQNFKTWRLITLELIYGPIRTQIRRTNYLGAVIIASANVILLVIFGGVFEMFFVAIGGMAVVTFIGVLTLADYVSIERSMSTGEMRSAMTASITVVHLAIQALALAGKIPA